MPTRRLPLRHVRRSTGRIKRARGFKDGNYRHAFASFVFRFIAVVFLVTSVFLGLRLFSQSVWSGQDRITFALINLGDNGTGGEVYLVSYLPAEQLSVISLPSALQVETIGGFGQWKIGSIYALGELEGKGGKLLSGTLSEFFGIDVDGWIVLSKKVDISVDTIKIDLRKILLKPVVGGGRSNFGLWDLLRLWGSISSVRAGAVEMVNLSTIGAFREEILPEGSKTYITDPERLDHLVQRLFSSTEVSKEGLSIAILNATEHQRLGNKAARAVENSGGDVVSVSDYPQPEEINRIIVSENNLRSSKTVSMLLKLYDIEEVSLGEMRDKRADILLVIGEDYWKKLTEF